MTLLSRVEALTGPDRVTDEQIAYAALWRVHTDNPAIHRARKILLAQIGGQGSAAQRQALDWMASVLRAGGPHED